MQKYLPFSVFVMTIVGSVSFVYSLSLHPTAASVSFLDVGQGDAILIESSNGNQILVDSGRGEQIISQLGEVMQFGDKHIDVLLASHYDADHIGGFDDVLAQYSSDTLIVNGAEPTTQTAKRLLDIVNEKDMSLQIASRGTTIDLGAGVIVRVLYPYANATKGNDGSIIMKVYTPNKTYMLTGDAPQKTENIVVGLEGDRLKSDVLKIGHHGSKTSSSNLFLRTVDPDIGIISAGLDNQYGHPHPDVMARLKDLGIPHLTTYRDGRIEF